MSVLAAEAAAPRRGPRVATFAWLVAAVAVVVLAATEDLPKWSRDYPRGWIWDLKSWITAAMKWLVNDATFGLFTFQEFTRSIAWVLDWFLAAAYGFLATGFDISSTGDGSVIIPRMSWIALIVVVTVMAWKVKDRWLALLVGLCFAYLAVFGQWDSAMVTLASIVIAVPLGAALGLLLGIAAYRRAWLERAITPLLDLMQTVPVFAYLVPILFLFGFGPVAAMIATMIYAMPPMVRITMLAMRQVPEEINEYGRMAGCSHHQHIWKVMVPAAKPGLMVGLNQVIMLSLNMVIIASMIGAGGLGFDVLHALRRLAIGEGFEAGIAITLLAIALDRLSQAFAAKPPPRHDAARAAGWIKRHPYLLAGVVLVLGSMALGAVVPFVESYPKALTVTTGTFFDHIVEWINVHLFDSIEVVKTWLVINVMVPIKRFLLAVPWPVFLIVIAMAGWQLGGWRLALIVACLAAFILVTGNWEKAMISVYLCGLSVVIACLIGFPIGVWAAGNARVNRVVQGVIDTLQTLPSFVYLIPVVMLFQVGDFSAMIAIVAYAIAPATRYTIHGLSQVPDHLIEAARAQGCSRRQILRKVELPLALPEIMLGVNQTIMMALSMLVITALVGTRDLGQEVYIALTKADTGRGIVAGVCVAFIAMIADRLISAWSTRRKKELGLPDTARNDTSPLDAARDKAASLAIWKGRVEPEPLSGGITNVNFKVVDDGEAYVVRIGGNIPEHGIRRTAEIACAKAAYLAGVAPELIHAEKGVIVTRFIEGRTYEEADVRDQKNLIRLLPLIKRLHVETPQHLRGRAPMFWVFHSLRDYFGRMADENHRLLKHVPRYREIIAELEKEIDRVKLIFGHNDLLPTNFIDDGNRIWIIDWEFAGFNSALFDLGGLASNNQLSVSQERWMLEAYYETPLGERQWRRYGAMKCASLLREAVWSMIQEHHSTLGIDYVAYTAENLKRFEGAYLAWKESA